MVQVQVDDTSQVENSRIIKLWKQGKLLLPFLSYMMAANHTYAHLFSASTNSTGRTSFVKYLEYTNGDEEATRSKILKSFSEYTAPVDKVNINVTPTKSAVVEFEFSVYSVCFPFSLGRHHPNLNVLNY